MILPPKSNFEVVDVGVDLRNLVGGVIGILLFLVVMVAGARNAGVALIVLGVSFCLVSLYFVIRIVAAVYFSQDLPARVERVWIERFKQPGYAGVRPLYRVRAVVEYLDMRQNVRIPVYPFAADNHFEDIQIAEEVANEVKDRPVVSKALMSGTFLLRKVGSQRWVTALAWVIAGSAFVSVGVFRIALG